MSEGYFFYELDQVFYTKMAYLISVDYTKYQ